MKRNKIARSALVAAVMAGATTAAVAGPDYNLLQTITVPVSAANSQSGNFTAFDISYVDPATGYDYIADRSNAAVDVINGATNTVVAQAGVGLFGGQQTSTAQSGPDGVVVANNGTATILYAGNGNTATPATGTKPSSTLLSFNVNTPSAPIFLNALSTGGQNRVDEMAFSGIGNTNSTTNHFVLVANNAEPGSPGFLPFATLVDTTTGLIAAGTSKIFIPNTPAPSAGGGLEQSVWDSKTGTFFVSVPAFNGTGNPGGVAEVNLSGTVIASYDFGASNFSGSSISKCSPTGLALGASGNLMVGCGAAKSQTVLLDPTANAGAGAIVKTFSGISGSDELYYDPASGDFFVTGDDATGANRIFAVISDSTDSVLQTVALPDVNAHSISVDPLNGEVFVPLEGSIVGGAQDALCPLGCVAVYAAPEPPPLAILFTAFLGLVTVGMWRRGHTRQS